jgi:hypothetical protein
MRPHARRTTPLYARKRARTHVTIARGGKDTNCVLAWNAHSPTYG